MCQNQSILMFNDAYAGTSTGESDRNVSKVVAACGNAASSSWLVVNASASTNLTFYLQGSYDGVMWDDITSTTATGFGRKTLSTTGSKYAFYRLAFTIAGTNVAAIIRAWLAMSSQ